MEGSLSSLGLVVYAGILLLTLMAAVIYIWHGKNKGFSLFACVSVMLAPMMTTLILIEAPYPTNDILFILREALSLNWLALLTAFLHLYIIIWWISAAFTSV